MFCLKSSQKYLPCSIKPGEGRLVSQEFIQYIQQVLLKKTDASGHSSDCNNN